MPLSARLWSGLAFTAFWASVGSAAPKPEKPKPPEFADVTQRVDVQFVEGLRSPEETTHEVFIVLKNKSGAALKGPLAVVFDNAKGTDFSFDWYTDTLADGQQYYGLVDVDDELPAKQTSRRRKLYLKTAAGVDEAQRAIPEIPFRVVQLSPEHVESKKPVDEVVEGKKYSREEFERVKAIQERAAEHLLSKHQQGVCGVFLSEDDNGNLNIQVATARRGVSREIPGTFEGVELQTEVVGGYRRLGSSPVADAAVASPSAVKPSFDRTIGFRRSFIDRPICIGVSGINITGVCASGTIGCRVRDQLGNLYALSNNHVFAEEQGFDVDGAVAGGPAVVGDVIQQPSPGEDVFTPCSKPAQNFLGSLTAWEPLRYGDPAIGYPPNVIDAAIATVTAQAMGFASPDDAYGVPSRSPVQPKLKLPVQKMGRTTGWTKGTLSGINGIVIVGYDEGGARFTQAISTKFVQSSTFGAGGDSGSLVVTQAGNNPVALLFAGSSLQSIFCPITPVLSRFNVAVDDGTNIYSGGHSGRIGTAVGPVNRGIRR